MKILNVLITLLVISILVSGGFLGYLMYSNSIEDGANPNINSNDNNTDEPINNNNSGDNVTADIGCSNLFQQGNGNSSELADLQLNFTSDSTGSLAVGDKVTVTASILSSNPAKKWKGLELRLIYPCENLKSIKTTSGSGDVLAIELDSEFNNIAEVHLATTKDSFEMGDKVVIFEFEVIKEGSMALEVADSSSLIDDQSMKYSIPTNKLSL
jgi:hypothetical protein